MNKYTFDFNALRGKIREVYYCQENLAKLIPMSNATLSLKLNNKVPFTAKEIKKISDLLKIDDIDHYFFELIV